MQHLTYSEKEFETEKKVVMEARRLRVEVNPQAYLIEQVHATAFQTQPDHWPISGWMLDLRRLSAEAAGGSFPGGLRVADRQMLLQVRARCGPGKAGCAAERRLAAVQD